MLKNKLKIPDKARKPFPDRLGSLVAGFDSRDGENGGSGAALEFGEELETIQPNGFASDRECEEPDDGVEAECVEGEDLTGGAGGGEPDFRARQRPTREGSGPVSVLEVIAADEKRSDVQYEISQEEINLEKLQRIASEGLPDDGGLRATTWKLLLGYLPPSRNLWEKELSENRLKYAKLKEELLISPSEFARRKNLDYSPCETEAGSDVDGPLRRHQISQEDHPLSLGKASVWNQYFENTEVAEQIDRDLQRTHPDMKFFSGETAISRRHREAMRNILLLFAKLNPAIRYVQGMNEVLAPIYYVFSTDPNEQNAANSEADSFSCFVRLLGDSVDHFCQLLDNSSVGILSTLARLSELLKTNDEELWRHLEFTTRVEPQFYAFRWITLLLTQEFGFQSILRIWDSLLGNPFGVQFFCEFLSLQFDQLAKNDDEMRLVPQDMLLRVCCAMLLCMKSKLLCGDFIANLKLLQHYPDIDIEHLLQVAMDLTPDTSSYRLSL